MAGHPQPYKRPELNLIYNLLFCDDLSLFQSKSTDPQPENSPFRVLNAPNPDVKAIEALANDVSAESRVRILAFNWLRQHGFTAQPKKLLGVIVEIPLKAGLEVLAAYEDGRIRYINHTGKLLAFEDTPPNIDEKFKELFDAAQAAVSRLGPWNKSRLPIPKTGMVRMTFLVSDGLYFGQGPLPVMEKDPMGGRVLRSASELLKLAVDASIK